MEATTSSPAIPNHPRMRGEHSVWQRAKTHDYESSPHARGTQVTGYCNGRRYRIIPACAGNTYAVPSTVSVEPNHPRMRGEHIEYAQQSFGEFESSPHARGTHKFVHITRLYRRIIPACAGNTNSLLWSLTSLANHPRMRGEHLIRKFTTALIGESSPHARGTPCRTR